MKRKDIVGRHWYQIFDISNLFIPCNTDSCCEYITGCVNIYLYGCVSLSAPHVLCIFVCVCVCVCMIPNESTKKKQHYRFRPSVNLSPCCLKNTQQGPSGTKLPRLNMCRSIIKSKHQFHPSSQKNKTAKWAVGATG